MAKSEFNEEMENYGPENYPKSAFIEARKVWDEREGSAIVRAANWRYCAFGLIFLSILLTGGIIYQSEKATVTPFVVLLGSDGAPIAAQQAAKSNYVPQEREIKYFLKEWVKKIRSIGSDPVRAKEDWVSAYSQLQGAAVTKMRDVMQQENPTGRLGKETQQVEVQVVVPVSANTYQVRWIETSYSKEGKALDVRKMTGLFAIEIHTPNDEKVIMTNPLGLFIKDVSWSRESK